MMTRNHVLPSHEQRNRAAVLCVYYLDKNDLKHLFYLNKNMIIGDKYFIDSFS